MSDLIRELIAIGNQLDECRPGENPQRARHLLRLRKQLRHAAEQAKIRAERFEAMQRKAARP